MKRTIIDAGQYELEDKVVSIKRVSKTVKGGRNMRFSALVVVGDKNVCVLVIAQAQPGGWGNAEILLYGALLILVYTLGAVLSVLLGRKKAARRYDIAERKVGRYEQMLRRLKWIYEKENRK